MANSLIRLESLLPDYYDDVIDMHQLAIAEQPQLDNLHASVMQAESNLFVATADGDGLGIFEDMLGIVVASGSTLESRRKVVFARLLNRKPYTMTYLRAVLSTLGGPATVKLEADKYQLDVDVSLDQPNQTDELDNILTTIVPVNLTIQARNTIYATTKGAALFAGGVVAADIVTLTNDWRDTSTGTAQANAGATAAFAETQMMTNDWRESAALKAHAYGATGTVAADTVTLTNDWHGTSTLSASEFSGIVLSGLEKVEVKSEE